MKWLVARPGPDTTFGDPVDGELVTRDSKLGMGWVGLRSGLWCEWAEVVDLPTTLDDVAELLADYLVGLDGSTAGAMEGAVLIQERAQMLPAGVRVRCQRVRDLTDVMQVEVPANLVARPDVQRWLAARVVLGDDEADRT